MNAEPAERPRSALFAVALALLSLAAAGTYANSLHNPFHFDDNHSIKENIYLKDPAFISRYFTDVTVFSPLAENRSYRPVLLLSYALSHQIGRGALWGYHLASILLHALGSILVALIGARIFVTSQPTPQRARLSGLFSGLLFAVHPLLSETVNYVSARSSLQAAVFTFLSLYLHMVAREERRPKLHLLSLLALLLGLGTKIISMCTPLLILGWELGFGPAGVRLRLRRPMSWKQELRELTPWVLPSLVLTVAFVGLHEALLDPATRGHRSNVPPWSYFLTEARVLFHYLGWFIWPEDLCADRTMVWSVSLFDGPTARAFLAHLTAVGLGLVFARRAPAPVFCGWWWYLSLAPTSSFAPLSEPATEHRVYIALPALCFGVALGFFWLFFRLESNRKKVGLLAFGVAILAALTTATVRRNGVWSSDELLWRDVTIRSPDNGRAHLNYGLALLARGDSRGARAAFDRCKEAWPAYAFCYINRAVLELFEGRPEQAEVEIAFAETLKPDNIYVSLWRGEVERALKRPPSAEVAYRRALKIAPGHLDAERGLALSLFEQGRFSEALPLIDRVTSSGSATAELWYASGLILQRQGRDAEAMVRYQAALGLDQSHRRARYNLAVAHQKAGRIDQAIAEYELLARAEGPEADTLYNLTLALLQRGQVEQARRVKSRLMTLHPAYPNLPALVF